MRGSVPGVVAIVVGATLALVLPNISLVDESAWTGAVIGAPPAASGSHLHERDDTEPGESLDVDLGHDFTRLGVAVFDRATETTLLRRNAEHKFSSASLVKLLIALESLEQGEASEEVRRMLAHSDDNIAGVLWTRYGRTRIVTEWADRIGLTATTPPASPRRWGDTSTSPADLVRTYRYLLTEVSGKVRSAVLGGLRATTERGADGFDQSFGIPDAAGSRPVAVKQGWSCCIWGRVLNTSGIVGADDRFIVIVLTHSSVAESWESARADLTELTTRIMDALPE